MTTQFLMFLANPFSRICSARAHFVVVWPISALLFVQHVHDSLATKIPRQDASQITKRFQICSLQKAKIPELEIEIRTKLELNFV